METIVEVKETMSMDLGSLLDAGDGAIVTLVAGETRLLAHKAVLSARSPVFAAMFRNNMLEASRGEVAIPDVEGPVLRQLLAYLYTLQAPQMPGMAPQLLAAADKYEVSVLKAECEKQVTAQLTVETAAAAAVLAIRHSCTALREAAVAYVKTHLVEVMATQSWADAVNTQPKDVVELSRLLSKISAPAPADGGTTPSTQPHSDYGDCRHNPASAAPSVAASRHTPQPDDAAVSRLQSVSAKEKGRRLIEAAKKGAVGELEALLAARADVGPRDRYKAFALHWAALKGHVEAVRRLVAAGAALRSRGGNQLLTPLHGAAGYGHAAVVQLLLAAGADHSARMENGWTPLHLAARWGRTDVAAALLEAGADSGARSSVGQTPLDIARQHNHQHLVDLLQGR